MSTPLQIQRVVAEQYALTLDKMLNKRTPHCARARHVAMWLCREVLELSYPAIGGEFKRDHSTALNAIRHINEKRAVDHELRRELDHLKARLELQSPHERTCGACGQPIGSSLRQATIAGLRSEITRINKQLELLEQAGT